MTTKNKRGALVLDWDEQVIEEMLWEADFKGVSVSTYIAQLCWLALAFKTLIAVNESDIILKTDV